MKHKVAYNYRRTEAMQKKKLLKDYESYNTFTNELNTDHWIDPVYRSIEANWVP